jgi:hypothetical protein
MVRWLIALQPVSSFNHTTLRNISIADAPRATGTTIERLGRGINQVIYK